MEKVFETVVTNIGSDAEMFKSENMIILFGENAPSTLADYCFNIEVKEIKRDITQGMDLTFDNTKYTISAVGSVVEKNLSDLGHITIKFDGAVAPELPGTLHVEKKELPEIVVGTNISIN